MIVSSYQKECMVIQFLTDKKEEIHWLHKHTDDIYEGLKVPLVIITEDEI
jgi:NAD(P)H-hydrate repair Nnr-like enzyme with NAD(P)H-hydrate dehydratase domain